MTREAGSRIVAIAVRAYRLLCRAYPKAFREQFGREVELDFREANREAIESGKTHRLFVAWAYAVLDVLANAPAARIEAQRDASHREQIRQTAYGLMFVVLPAIALVRIIGDSVSPAMLWSQLAGLSVHCVLMCLAAIALRSHVRATLAVACCVLIALSLEALGQPLAWRLAVTPTQLVLVNALRLALPVTVVLGLVKLAPLFARRQGRTRELQVQSR